MNQPASESYLAVEIGGSKLQLAVGRGDGFVCETCRRVVDRHGGAEGIRTQIEADLPSLISSFRPQGVGIGFGGPVDVASGCISRSHQIHGWTGFDLAGWMRGLTGLPVVVDNDANLAALAEARIGAGAGRDPVFYVTMGSGVGGGLVRGGSLYHGAAPGEAELGHVRLDRRGRTVEQACSGWAIDAAIQAGCSQHPQSMLSRLAAESSGQVARYWKPALEAGDAWALSLLETWAGDLALGLSHVVHLFHPQTIVLGGGLSLVGEPLCQAVQAALRPLVMEVFRDGIDVRLAALGEEVVPVGALLAAHQAALKDGPEGRCG